MKTLHILRSEPDDVIRMLMEEASADGESVEIPLFQGEVDYDRLATAIFESDQVISWW